MDINILEDFLKLAELSNFSRAASERHITQPAFSRRIKVLEDYVGAELIDRSKSPIRLTPAGQSFQSSTRELLDRLQNAKDNARTLDDSDQFHVNLAFSHSVITNYLPLIFSVMMNHVSSFRVNAYSDNTEYCIETLVNGSSHFLSAMYSHEVALPDRLKQFPYAVLSQTCLIPVSKSMPDGAPMYKLDTEAESPIPFLTFAADSYLLQVIRKFVIGKCDDSLLDVVLHCSNSDALIGLVVAGQGIAWLPEFTIRNALKSGAIVPAGTADWNIPLEYRLYGRSAFSPIVEEVIADLQKAIAEESQSTASEHHPDH